MSMTRSPSPGPSCVAEDNLELVVLLLNTFQAGWDDRAATKFNVVVGLNRRLFVSS